MSRVEVPDNPLDAVSDIADGAAILCGGFSGAGSPSNLIQALASRKVRELTMVANNAGQVSTQTSR